MHTERQIIADFILPILLFFIHRGFYKFLIVPLNQRCHKWVNPAFRYVTGAEEKRLKLFGESESRGKLAFHSFWISGLASGRYGAFTFPEACLLCLKTRR